MFPIMKKKKNQRVPNVNVATLNNLISRQILIQKQLLQANRICYRCGGSGHYYARNCRSVSSQNEVPGKSTAASTSCSAAVKSESSHLQKLTEEQLEVMLAKLRLEKDESLLHKQAAKVNTIFQQIKDLSPPLSLLISCIRLANIWRTDI